MRQTSEKTGGTTDEDGKMATRRLFSGGQSNFQHGTLPARSRSVLLHCNAQQPGNRSCVSVPTHDCKGMRYSKSRDSRPRHQGAVCQRNAGKTASIHRFRRQNQQCLHHNPFMGVHPTIFFDGIGCACRQTQIRIIDAVFVFCVSNFHDLFPFKFRFSLVSQAKPARKEYVRPPFCKSVMNTRTKVSYETHKKRAKS